ncbi:MAG: FixH family protein [Balneolaceae bacterium]|nr:FixH family protein [Balneolaceae bacterium]
MLVILLTAPACQSSGESDTGITLDWSIEPNPPKVGHATINIALQDSTDTPIKGAKIQLEGNMSHPGMKPVLAEAKEVKPGHYSAKMEFSMSGDWFILVNATLPDERVIERQINISGVRSE